MSLIDKPERQLTPTELPAADKDRQCADSQLVKMRAKSDQRLMDLTAERSARGVASSIGSVAIGQPIVNDYVAFDIACTSPIQFEGLPPYRPGKVIAGGEEAFVVAFL